jgi:ACS family tartrate transporter-like MFS transporter
LLTISIAAAGISSAAGPFWTLPAGFLDGTAAAGGIALINSTGNLAGFVGPTVVGLIRQITGSFSGGMLAMAMAVLVAGVLALAMPRFAGHQQRASGEALSESS